MTISRQFWNITSSSASHAVRAFFEPVSWCRDWFRNIWFHIFPAVTTINIPLAEERPPLQMYVGVDPTAWIGFVLSRTLDALSPQDRFLATSYFIDRMTALQISQLLGEKESAISRRLKRITPKVWELLLQTSRSLVDSGVHSEPLDDLAKAIAHSADLSQTELAQSEQERREIEYRETLEKLRSSCLSLQWRLSRFDSEDILSTPNRKARKALAPAIEDAVNCLERLNRVLMGTQVVISEDVTSPGEVEFKKETQLPHSPLLKPRL